MMAPTVPTIQSATDISGRQYGRWSVFRGYGMLNSSEALLLLCCSILGMHIFGCKFSLKTETGDTVPDRKNFDSLLWAIVTVFQVINTSLFGKACRHTYSPTFAHQRPTCLYICWRRAHVLLQTLTVPSNHLKQTLIKLTCICCLYAVTLYFTTCIKHQSQIFKVQKKL